MIVVNFFGQSCTGKSGHASALFGELKKRGFKVELVREHCKTYFYEGTQYKLDNQMLTTGKQIEQTAMYERGGCDIVVTDSPILLGAFYHTTYNGGNTPLADAIRLEHHKFHNYNIYMERDVEFDSFGRGKSGGTNGITQLIQDEPMWMHQRYKTSELVRYDNIISGIGTIQQILEAKALPIR